MNELKVLVIPFVLVSVFIIVILFKSHELRHAFRLRTPLSTKEWTVKNEGTPIEYLIPGDEDLRMLNKTQLYSIGHRYIDHLDVLCGQQIRAGKVHDGGKQVCVDDAVKPKYGQCLVYSFGSHGEFSFEISVIDLLGCEIHTFDPYKSGKTAPTGCTYHQIGLDGKNGSKLNKGVKRNFLTLESIMKKLKHTRSIIDILKIDIEGGEWAFFDDVLSSNLLSKHVKQILIEIHLPFEDLSSFRRALSLLRRLHENGFLAFSRERNVYCKYCVKYIPELNIELCLLSEFSFLNRRFLEI